MFYVGQAWDTGCPVGRGSRCEGGKKRGLDQVHRNQNATFSTPHLLLPVVKGVEWMLWDKKLKIPNVELMH